MKKQLLLLFVCMMSMHLFAQDLLSVEHIMQDPRWMGTFPSDVKWSEDSESILFYYNPDNNAADSLYSISLKSKNNLNKVSFDDRKNSHIGLGSYNSKQTEKTYSKQNTLYLYNAKTKHSTILLEFPTVISNPNFMFDENWISFQSGLNAYTYNSATGQLKKLTTIKTGNANSDTDSKTTEKDQWLETENLELLEIVNARKTKADLLKTYREKLKEKPGFSYFTDSKQVSNMAISPNAQFVTFSLLTMDKSKKTIVPDFIDASGYTTDLNTRAKVGDHTMNMELAIYNIAKDTVYLADYGALEGLTDLPDYTSYYPESTWIETERDVFFSKVHFSDNGQKAVVNVRSKDHKDRWIAQLDLQTGKLSTLDRQRDEAWIAGPGIGWAMGGEVLGWLSDHTQIYFQSEASGYSHLYLLDTQTKTKKALTSGDYEVFDPILSKNKTHFYFTSSEDGPDVRHFYKMPILGGTKEKLTDKIGNNEVTLSPDEKHLAIRYSYSNLPWELYYKPNTTKGKTVQLTSGQSKTFASYKWRDPEIVQIKARDGENVATRIYHPNADVKNNAAVIFVHGAGYLQNVHQWWSSYFREYMFHNLLADLGYTVIDMDYRGSAGYGRDWRTGIYRHMGEKDLTDHVDGAKYLMDTQGIDADKIGIYGGSYGGFITLMALFKEAETFKSGAALRSVTDWAHYNHFYTANILNEPSKDPIAYKQSSPIYFAEGLEGHLLIAHGMVDTNVHFQDVVRLSQRLIELQKNNWELAVYPAEDHGFIEPSSWIDEYKRILKLFNSTLLNQ